LANPFTKEQAFPIIMKVQCFIKGMEDLNKSVAQESMKFVIELTEAVPTSTERIDLVKVLN
jgi:hypothetical protein